MSRISGSAVTVGSRRHFGVDIFPTDSSPRCQSTGRRKILRITTGHVNGKVSISSRSSLYDPGRFVYDFDFDTVIDWLGHSLCIKHFFSCTSGSHDFQGALRRKKVVSNSPGDGTPSPSTPPSTNPTKTLNAASSSFIPRRSVPVSLKR